MLGLFDKKYCSICNAPIGLMQNNRLRDGNLCNNCRSLLSPLHMLCGRETVETIKNELECRNNNKEKLKRFRPSKVFGEQIRVFIDEARYQLAVSGSGNFFAEQADIISLIDITNCSVEVSDTKNEIKYRDSNGEVNSFSPPCYAYSYDFYAIIDVRIPYIQRITVRLNSKPVDNGQPLIIDMGQGGVLNRVVDKLYKGKSYNGGKTNNADEVMASASYHKFEAMANEMKEALAKRPQAKKQTSDIPQYCKCSWCGSKVLRTQESCNHCGGVLDI